MVDISDIKKAFPEQVKRFDIALYNQELARVLWLEAVSVHSPERDLRKTEFQKTSEQVDLVKEGIKGSMYTGLGVVPYREEDAVLQQLKQDLERDITYRVAMQMGEERLEQIKRAGHEALLRGVEVTWKDRSAQESLERDSTVNEALLRLRQSYRGRES